MTYQELLNSIVTDEDFQFVKPYHLNESIGFIQDIMNTNNPKVMIMGDWDVDGIHSAKIVYNDLKEFGIRPDNISVYFGESKAHGIQTEFLKQCQEKHCTHIIIVDSSSNDLDELTYLRDCGFKVMVIDHHVSQYSYDDYADVCTIVNSKLPYNEDIKEISAGFLCSILSYYWRKTFDLRQSNDNLIYGYMTLHSDGCLLYDSFIRPLVMYPEKLGCTFPIEIEAFTNKYTKLNRDFVNWTYAPRINNLCRHNRSDILENLFFKPITSGERNNLVNLINSLYSDTKNKLDDLVLYSDEYTTEHNGVLLINLDKAIKFTSLPWEYLVNSTGLVAGKLSDKYRKPAIAYINNHYGEYKMSGRDASNTVNFQNMLKAYNLSGGGHLHAVGFVIPIEDFGIFMKQIDITDYKVIGERCFIWDFTKINPYKIKTNLAAVARYNEVAIGKLKPIYFKISLNSHFDQKQFGKLRIFSYAGLNIKDLKSQKQLNTEVLIRPNISAINEAFIVYEEEKK